MQQNFSLEVGPFAQRNLQRASTARILLGGLVGVERRGVIIFCFRGEGVVLDSLDTCM